MAGQTEAKIRFADVEFAYQTEKILRGISLDIAGGEFVCLLGPSGCGKSTLLSLIEGLNFPDAGQVLTDGSPVEGPGLDRGVVFQDYSLFPWMSTGKNVLLALRQAFPKTGKKELKEKVLHYFRLLGLYDVYDKLPGELSGGMRQRAAIARAFAIEAPVLLMDEPFGALDAITRGTLQELLAELWKKERKTVIFVTHDVDEALFLATRIIILGSGRIRRDISLPADEIRYRDLYFREDRTIALRQTILKDLEENERQKIWAYSI